MTLIATAKIATHTSDDHGNGLDDKWEHRYYRGASACAIDPDEFEGHFGTIVDVVFADEDTQNYPIMITLDRDEKWVDTSADESYIVTHGTVVTIEYEDLSLDRDA